MKAQYTHDLVATIGEYTDRTSGEKKKRRINVGKLFTDDQGRMSFKMDSIPVGPEWSGWVSLYERNDDNRSTRQATPAAIPKAKPEPEGGDDIPF